MIIKSMSRKVPSFGQLIGYIDRDEGQEQWRAHSDAFGHPFRSHPATCSDVFGHL